MDLTLTWDDARARANLDFVQNRLYVARALVPFGYEAFFRERARYVSAHTSTSIEGNQLGFDAALLVMVEGSNPGNPQEVEVTNLDEAYDLVTQIASDHSTRIDHGLIRSINSLILRGMPEAQARNRGRYRAGANLIVDAKTRVVRYRTPPHIWVPELMDGLVASIERWRAAGVPAPIVAAAAHFALISIHPFDDGNGRTARLLADMILHQEGWAAEGMISLSQGIFDERARYYDALRTVQGDEFAQSLDITAFIEFHNEMLMVAGTRLEEEVIEFRRRLDRFRDEVGESFNHRQALAFMYMLDLRPLSSSGYARLTGSSQTSAVNDLGDLVRRGLVERVGGGRNTRYRVLRDFS